MKSKQDADVAQQALNGQWIGQRYIEVFPYCEEADAPSDGHLKGEDVSALGGSGQEPEVPSVGDTGGSSSPIPNCPCAKSEIPRVNVPSPLSFRYSCVFLNFMSEN